MDHSEQCRSRMETILLTTTEGHERLERVRDRFAQAAKEPEDEEWQESEIALHRGSGWRTVPHTRFANRNAIPQQPIFS